jgi:hypothetical protein
MSDQAKGGGKAAKHVEQHLKKHGLTPAHLDDSVIDALNSCSPDELAAMDKVGASMEAAGTPTSLRVAAVH